MIKWYSDLFQLLSKLMPDLKRSCFSKCHRGYDWFGSQFPVMIPMPAHTIFSITVQIHQHTGETDLGLCFYRLFYFLQDRCEWPNCRSVPFFAIPDSHPG